VLEQILAKIGGLGDFCMKTDKMDLVAKSLNDPHRAEVLASRAW
jgi:hypothetical protein